MKKTAIVVLAIASFAFTGCLKNKEKTCECTTTYSDPSYSPQVQTHETSQDCSFYEDSYVSGGLSAVTTCEEI